MGENEPATSSAARFPADYGVPGSEGETGERIAWSYVEGRLREAGNYWLTTVSPAGTPEI